MKRAVALVIGMMLLTVFSTGCEDDPVGVSETGIEVRFSDCLVFGVHVFIDGRYQGIASTEQPRFFPLSAGTYDLYAKSNASLDDVHWCWERRITVTSGNVTDITMSCKGAQCPE